MALDKRSKIFLIASISIYLLYIIIGAILSLSASNSFVYDSAISLAGFILSIIAVVFLVIKLYKKYETGTPVKIGLYYSSLIAVPLIILLIFSFFNSLYQANQDDWTPLAVFLLVPFIIFLGAIGVGISAIIQRNWRDNPQLAKQVISSLFILFLLILFFKGLGL